MVKLTIDGKEVSAEEGKSLLEVCLENGIYIPNLCFLKDMEAPPASCRLCFVQIEGKAKPVVSCREKPVSGMVVQTDTDAVRRLQRSALELLLSAHKVECRHCHANKKCELQRIAKFLHVGLKPKRLEPLAMESSPVLFHPLLAYDPHKCVLCGKCVFVCRNRDGYELLTFAKRGIDTVIACFGADDSAVPPCDNCRECVNVCPVGALRLKDDANHTAAAQAQGK
jgi:NADH dehydrogenase/NADH:ubiquinone oxidoreductase subunit G